MLGADISKIMRYCIDIPKAIFSEKKENLFVSFSCYRLVYETSKKSEFYEDLLVEPGKKTVKPPK